MKISLCLRLLAFTGCDAFYSSRGILIDKSTGKRVIGAKVSELHPYNDPPRIVYSDSSGRFCFTQIYSGLAGYSRHRLIFEKEGYLNYITGKRTFDGDTIYMLNSETKK